MLKRFFRWVVRTVIIAAVLLVIAAINDYWSHRIKPGSVLVVTLQGPVLERGPAGISSLISGGRQTALNQVREAMHKAGHDPRIVGVALKIIDPEMEFAQAQEIAAMVQDAARKGKWTSAYMETAGELGPGNLPYIAATAAREVSMMPQGQLGLIGVGVREFFARGTLDWLGLKPDFEAIGKYKSAMNIFTEKDFTAAQREEDEALVSDLYDQVVGQVSRQRHVSPDAVRAIIDHAPLTPEDGIKQHLLDRVEYADQFEDRIKHYGGQKHALVDFTDYVRPFTLPRLRTPDRIAVIYGDGEINRDSGAIGTGAVAMTADKMAGAFKTAREDNSVKAIVFRINSPGGSVVASELIRHEAELTARDKPLVVSMSGYGASGGYWIATPARRIFADPGTITGSIGVLAGKFNLAPLAQKWGVNTQAITRGANFEMFDGFTDFTPEQEAMMREQVLGDTYRRFVKLVADSRHLTLQQVDQIAQGRVWTGSQAAGIKLVDSLGGFDAALDEARADAGMKPGEPVEIVELPEQPGLLQQLLGGGFDARAAIASLTGSIHPLSRLLRTLMAGRGALGRAYCPVTPVM